MKNVLTMETASTPWNVEDERKRERLFVYKNNNAKNADKLFKKSNRKSLFIQITHVIMKTGFTFLKKILL